MDLRNIGLCAISGCLVVTGVLFACGLGCFDLRFGCCWAGVSGRFCSDLLVCCLLSSDARAICAVAGVLVLGLRVAGCRWFPG